MNDRRTNYVQSSELQTVYMVAVEDGKGVLECLDRLNIY